MSISMYEATVPVIERALRNLIAVLEKGAAHAAERNFDPAALLQDRIYPDMFPLTRQVQIASDVAKGCLARLSGADAPSWADTETSFPELIARVQKTLDYMASFGKAQIEGSETREVVVRLRSGELKFSGWNYLQQFVLPNLYFHCTTTYALLRHNGVALGKNDFLGAF